MAAGGRTQGAQLWRDALHECRELIFWAVVFGAGVNILYLAPSLFMMQVYDRVLQTGGLATLWFVGGILVFALATLAFLDAIRHRLLARASFRLDRLLSAKLLDAAQRAEGAGAGERRQVMRAFDGFRQALTGPAANAVMDAPWAPLYIGVAFLLHPMIGLVTLSGGAVLIFLAIRNEHVLRLSIAQSGELAQRNYVAQEADNAFAEAARALGMRKILIERQIKGRAESNRAQAKTLFSGQSYSSITRFLRLLLQSTALGVGAWLAVEGQISPGALIAGSILSSRALSPLEQIVNAWRQIGEAKNQIGVIQRALDGSDDGDVRTALPKPSGALRLENVGARVPGTDRAAIQNINLAVAPGEVIGVIGPSGAGKSTLARIAAGALRPDVGIVRLDGANVLDWNPDVLGAHVGYLPQELALLTGTVAENIRRFEVKDETNSLELDAATVEAAMRAGAHEMILRLPGGYDAPLGRGGRGLSLGQSQRIALARAHYRSPSLLVLDEPNAHLDHEGELALTASLQAAKAEGAAIIVVAHRAGVLALVDRLVVLRDGRIETIGSREEVLASLAQSTQQLGARPAALNPNIKSSEALS